MISVSGVITGKAAGSTVMVLDTDAKGLLHSSLAVHVSVTVPPQGPGVAEKVDRSDIPLIWHGTGKLLLKVIVLGAGIEPQGTVVSASGVIVGKAAGLT